MKKVTYLLTILLIFSNCNKKEIKNEVKIAIAPQKLFCIVNDDVENDPQKIEKKDKQELNQTVNSYLLPIYLKQRNNYVKHWIENLSPEEIKKEEIKENYFWGNIFRIKYNDIYDLYAYELKWDFGINYIYFFLYNKNNGKIIDSFQPCYTKWIGAYLDKPFVYFRDIDMDSENEIFIKEQTHNGTMYNAVIEHIYKINSDNVIKLFTYESKTMLMFGDEGNNTDIFRFIIPISNNQINIEAYFGDMNNKRNIKFGTITLIKADKFYNLLTIDYNFKNTEYAGAIYSGADEDINDFIKNGYKVYY